MSISLPEFPNAERVVADIVRRGCRCLALCIVMLLAACQAFNRDPYNPQAASISQDVTTIPLTVTQHGILASVMLDGKGPFTFIVDTGSGAVIVTPEVADALKLNRLKIRPLQDRLADGTTVTSNHGVAHLERLAIGAAEFRDFYVRIGPAAGFITSPKIDGILGFPVMQHFAWTLDMPNHTLRIGRTSPLKGVPVSDPTLLPLRAHDGVPLVSLTVARGLPAQQSVDVVLDTGSTFPLVLPPSMASAFDAATEIAEVESATIYGHPVVKVERHFTPIEFPGMVLSNNPIVFFASGPVYAMGLPLLRHYVVTFDASRKLMRMQLTDPPPAGYGAILPATRQGSASLMQH